MGKTGIILHSVIQADECISNNLHAGNLLFSTHCSVDVYLREKYSIDCQCLSKLWNTDEVIAYKNTASQRVDQILQALDSRIAPVINQEFSLKMRYFTPLYSYLGKYCYCGYSFFIASIRKIIDKYNLKEIVVYNTKPNTFFANANGLEEVLSVLFDNIKIVVVIYPDVPGNKLKKIKHIIDKIILKNPKYILDRIFDLYYKEIRPRLKVLDNVKLNILLIENLYDLKFLRNTLSQYNVFHFLPQEDRFCGKRDLLLGKGWTNIFSPTPQRHLAIPPHLFDIPLTDNLDQIFVTDIKADFLTNINHYLKDLGSLKSFQEKWPVSLAIWGNSPITGLKALVVEYLRSEAIPVMGSQHGALFGDAYEPWQFDSDFNRSDFFVSYGFTEEDLRRLYPDRDIQTKILPFGASSANGGARVKTPIDILFPLTNSLSSFEGGMLRTLPDRLADTQIVLLEYLDSLADLNIYIKPFMFSGDHNSAVIPVLQRMKKVKIVDYMPLNGFLRKYHPKVILVEFPSTPLCDALHLDSEIFLLDNPIIPYDKNALEQLQKRVHYCQDVFEMIAKLDLFLKGHLKKKRDQSFYHHYMFKDNTQKNILSLIDKVVRRIDPPT
jgi:hypothetical protein